MKPDDITGRDLKFLAGGGEMGGRIRAFDWTQSPLGPIENWPQSLKTSVSLMLNSQHPMWIGWGPAATFLYNDAYIQVLSLVKHPWALGKPAAEVWSEIWDICGPLADKVFKKGEASFLNDVRLFMSRGDFLEETFYSFSYSPIRDESGSVGGLFCPSADVSPKVLNTRRLQTLSELAAKSLVEKSIVGACASAAAILARNPDDIPFALLYLIDPAGNSAHLEQAVGIQEKLPLISPETLDLAARHEAPQLWPVAKVMATSQLEVLPIRELEGFPLGLAEQRLAEAVVLPVIAGGQERPLAILVAGVSPARKLDAEYRTFYELVAGHVATAIQSARAAEEEKHRADMLAELDRAKTAFFSNVSHEFRTPLTLMLGPLEDLLARKKTTLSTEDAVELEVIHRNSLRLLRLVNTLLDFSRIEAGRTQGVFVATDLAALTADLASMFRSAMEKAGLEFAVDCPVLAQSAWVDRDMWEKIVFNLLSNALKFTLSGKVSVSLRAEDGTAILSVRDTGVGIPVSELPNVFKRFHRVENTRGRSHEGTGIGLALASELVKLHGGKIEVESQPGHGTVFHVRVPLGEAHLPAERVASAPAASRSPSLGAAFVEEASTWLLQNGLPASSRKKATGRKDDPARPRILLVEDNADMRDYVQRLLHQDYEVHAVADGATALAAAKENPPHLVLSDIMMPGLDGFGLMRELRSHPATRAIPIVLLSARAGEESRIEGTEAGADDYLTKPFSARELLARVNTHLKLTRVRREAEEQLREALTLREQSEAKTRAAMESINDGLHVVDARGCISYFNAAGRSILAAHGQDADGMLGRDFFEVFPATLETEVGRAMKRTLSERIPTEAESFYIPWRKWFSVRHFPTLDGGVSTFFQDITARKEAEALLRQNEALFSALVDQAPTGVYVIDAQFRLQQINALAMPAFAKVHPRIGRNFAEVMHILWGKELGDQIVKIFRHTLATGERYISPRFAEFRQDLGVEKAYEWETQRVTLPDGQHGVVCYFNDITERELATNALQQANALLADKAGHLEALVQQRTAKLSDTIGELEAFSYSIAHDMRAPLRSLQGFAGILLSNHAPRLDEECQNYLRLIARSSNRMDRLIQDVLNYSRIVRGEYPSGPVDIEKLLRGIVDTYPKLGPDDADVVLRGPFPIVLGNEAMLLQIFSNLMGNAVKFVAPGVKPRISIWAEPTKTHARFFVEDNGIGIAADQHEKIFGIFQRVSKDYEGTGIGLAIVKKAVERLGGQLGIQSAPGQGTTFWIEVPLAVT